MLKSNFDLVDGKFVGCCIAVATKFHKICSSLSRSKRRANFHIFFAKLALCMFNLCIYLICIQLPRVIQLKLEHFFRKTILIEKNTRSYDVLSGLTQSNFHLPTHNYF